VGGVGLFVVIGSFCEEEIRMSVKSREKRNTDEASAAEYRSSSFVSQAVEDRFNEYTKNRVGIRERGC